jgi:thermitase
VIPDTKRTAANLFRDFLNSEGIVFQSGSYQNSKRFEPTFFAAGYPISQAYWAQVKVAGQTKWVLTQAFERR